LSGLKCVRVRSDGGFTLTEALAALVVIALAMGQVVELMGQFARAVGATRTSVEQARSVLSGLEEIESDPESSGGRIVIDEKTFQVTAASPRQGPCTFDATGRRCR
jgi:prepilin-type N-terminal cleavage/methylation domain-containing protein